MRFNLKVQWLYLALAFPSLVNAQPTPSTGNGLWYYELGGGQPYLSISSANKTNVPFGAGLDWSLGGVCGFDPVHSFSDELENGKLALQNLQSAALAGAQNLLTGSLLSEIRELNPGLYDTLTRSIFAAKDSLAVSIKSCEQMNSDVLAGGSPVDGWVTLSKRSTWAQGSASGDNPTTVATEVSTDGGNDGITWVDGERAGGVDQPPIEVVSDTVEKGYQQWDDQNSADPLNSTFPTVESAQEWTTAVVGDNIIRTCVECEKIQTKVGQGLKLQYMKEREVAFEDAVTVLTSSDIQADELAALAVPGMGIYITDSVILALRAEDIAERELLTNRMASEVAIARTLEKALVARSLLRAGIQDPNIQANGEALEELTKRLTLLSEEIDNVLFEQRVRSEVLTNTSQMILARANARNTAPVGTNIGTSVRTPSLSNGALSTD